MYMSHTLGPIDMSIAIFKVLPNFVINVLEHPGIHGLFIVAIFGGVLRYREMLRV